MVEIPEDFSNNCIWWRVCVKNLIFCVNRRYAYEKCVFGHSLDFIDILSVRAPKLNKTYKYYNIILSKIPAYILLKSKLLRGAP